MHVGSVRRAVVWLLCALAAFAAGFASTRGILASVGIEVSRPESLASAIPSLLVTSLSSVILAVVCLAGFPREPARDSGSSRDSAPCRSGYILGQLWVLLAFLSLGLAMGFITAYDSFAAAFSSLELADSLIRFSSAAVPFSVFGFSILALIFSSGQWQSAEVTDETSNSAKSSSKINRPRRIFAFILAGSAAVVTTILSVGSGPVSGFLHFVASLTVLAVGFPVFALAMFSNGVMALMRRSWRQFFIAALLSSAAAFVVVLVSGPVKNYPQLAAVFFFWVAVILVLLFSRLPAIRVMGEKHS